MDEPCPRKLLDQVHDAIRLNHYRAVQAETGWIRRCTSSSAYPPAEGALSTGTRIHRIV
jgi:hypothetical protein